MRPMEFGDHAIPTFIWEEPILHQRQNDKGGIKKRNQRRIKNSRLNFRASQGLIKEADC